MKTYIVTTHAGNTYQSQVDTDIFAGKQFNLADLAAIFKNMEVETTEPYYPEFEEFKLKMLSSIKEYQIRRGE